MLIHEVTQLPPRPGILSTISPSAIASGFVQGLTGVNFPRPQEPAGSTTAQATQTITTDKSKPAPGSIFLVKAPGGMEHFKDHRGIWFEKPGSREIYSASGALQIKDPVKANKLNQLLPRAQTIYVKSASQGDTINFVPDPSGRTAKLAAKRLKSRVK